MGNLQTKFTLHEPLTDDVQQEIFNSYMQAINRFGEESERAIKDESFVQYYVHKHVCKIIENNNALRVYINIRSSGSKAWQSVLFSIKLEGKKNFIHTHEANLQIWLDTFMRETYNIKKQLN
jgi:hypothetical protein